MENNLLLFKPWTAPKIWKLGRPRILTVHVAHPDCLWRCISHWLQGGAWRNVGDMGQGKEPMGIAPNTFRQSTGGTACTPTSRVLNLTPVSSFTFGGMGMETVWGSGAKLRVWSMNLPRSQGLW